MTTLSNFIEKPQVQAFDSQILQPFLPVTGRM